MVTNTPKLPEAWKASPDPEILGKIWGYTFEPQETCWVVRKNEAVIYYVYPYEGTCSCPATKICKHLRFVWILEKLVPCLR
jgi:hypothetical protein